MKTILLLSVLAVLLSCAETKIMTVSEEEVVESTDNPNTDVAIKHIKAKIGKFMESDHVDIESVIVKGNALFIAVSYSGGCKEHELELIGNPLIMKSLPPKRAIQLYHNANGDSCRSLVNEILEIDITDLAYSQTEGSEIILVLEGWEEEIKYIFK